MADTSVQREVENWVRDQWLPEKFAQQFHKRKCKLDSGGDFEFDAVSQDSTIVALISTSRYKTARGKHGSGKVQKIRADINFLQQAQADQHILLLTEPDMLEFFQKERAKGRVSQSIHIALVSLPESLSASLKQARDEASREVSS